MSKSYIHCNQIKHIYWSLYYSYIAHIATMYSCFTHIHSFTCAFIPKIIPFSFYYCLSKTCNNCDILHMHAHTHTCTKHTRIPTYLYHKQQHHLLTYTVYLNAKMLNSQEISVRRGTGVRQTPGGSNWIYDSSKQPVIVSVWHGASQRFFMTTGTWHS